MKSLFTYSAVLSLLFIGVSCSNSDDDGYTPMPDSVITTFTATLTPVSGSTGSGSATLKLNETAKTFEITVSYMGLTSTPTMGHIHKTNGDIDITFPNVSASPITHSGSITDAQIAGLKTETYYVNLHTNANPTGEIKGTLTKTGSSGDGGGGGGTY